MSDFPPNLSIRPLTIEDLQQCVELEAKGFSEEERCSEEKMRYRLTVAPELCSGLFIRDFEYRYNSLNLPEVAQKIQREHDEKESFKQNNAGKGNNGAKTNEGKEKGKNGENPDKVNDKNFDKDDEDDIDDDDDDDDDEDFPARSSVIKETLVGHIIGTKIYGTKISEESMQLPTQGVKGSGHVETSRTIGIHSVVVDPEWRGKNLAALLLHDYIQKLSNQDVGDQVVLIAHDTLIPFYEKIGFNNLGESACKYAGSTWYDMAIDLVATDDL